MHRDEYFEIKFELGLVGFEIFAKKYLQTNPYFTRTNGPIEVKCCTDLPQTIGNYPTKFEIFLSPLSFQFSKI